MYNPQPHPCRRLLVSVSTTAYKLTKRGHCCSSSVGVWHQQLLFFSPGCRTFPQSESEFAFCAAEAVKSRLIQHICIVLQNVVSCVCVRTTFAAFLPCNCPLLRWSVPEKLNRTNICRFPDGQSNGRTVGRSVASGRDSMKINCKKPQTLMSTNVSHSSCAGWLVAWLDGWLVGWLAGCNTWTTKRRHFY